MSHSSSGSGGSVGCLACGAAVVRLQCTACLQEDQYGDLDDSYVFCSSECFKGHFWMHKRSSQDNSPVGVSPTGTPQRHFPQQHHAHGHRARGVMRPPPQGARPHMSPGQHNGAGLNANATAFRKT